MTDRQMPGCASTRARPPKARRVGARARYTPELAEAICARIAQGESLRAITAALEMPTQGTVRAWQLRRPAFAEAMAQARESAAAIRCGQPAPVGPTNLEALREEPEQRRLETARGASSQGRRQEHLPDGRVRCVDYDAQVVDAICGRLASGETWSKVCGRRGFPAWSTLYAWMRKHPGVAERVAEARRIAAEFRFDQALDVAMKSEPASVQSDKLKVATLLHHAGALDPARFGGPGRGGAGRGGDDAVQTIVIKRFERAVDDNGESYVRVIDHVQTVAQ
jgi:hypothetical protein